MFLAIVNSKGGVGKSTLAVHAAVWLHERGVRVAVIDADAQASTSEWLAQAAPVIRIERCDNLAALAERVPRLTAVYDAVVADGPAALSAETVALASAADLVVLPIGPSMMDIRASYRTARVLYNVRLRLHRGDKPHVVTVLNRVQPRTRLAQLALAAVQKYGFPVAATCLNLRQAYAEACGVGSVAWRMGPGAKHAGTEIRRLLEEVLGPHLRSDAPVRAVAEVPPTLPVSKAVMPAACPPAATPPRTLPAAEILAGSTPLPLVPGMTPDAGERVQSAGSGV